MCIRDSHIIGVGKIIGPGKVSILGEENKEIQTLDTENIMIASGSRASTLPGIKIDEKQIVSSTGALSLSQVPKEMVIIGAGVIGLELGSVWSRLGANVTVVEYFDTILPGMDTEVSKTMQGILKKQGLKFKMKTKVIGESTTEMGVSLNLENRDL